MDQSLVVEIPFETSEQAKAVYNAIFPDSELKPDEITRKTTQEDRKLVVEFRAKSERSLRVGVNSFMDTLALSVECVDSFA
ncbi:EKC/KEOPS complex subunit PCC1 [Wickerhamiella sorbophila]|uniref:EKC/KEOPS complex subunit PCC1 n=1 Tax=Wickerhamiella sorbophila TaxID=45607 RepID=A0A2T0FET7_9ASCO|nr:EKC/KEOPS complex subunit PCC1 [Wickerhamiella sorbophila]PRT53477.1 EKC/KEOPS complex subunit PCC1 [Wickerhamiella sorbophila]